MSILAGIALVTITLALLSLVAVLVFLALVIIDWLRG